MTAPQGTQPTTKTNVFDYESTYIACKLPTFAVATWANMLAKTALLWQCLGLYGLQTIYSYDMVVRRGWEKWDVKVLLTGTNARCKRRRNSGGIGCTVSSLCRSRLVKNRKYFCFNNHTRTLRTATFCLIAIVEVIFAETTLKELNM